MICCVLISSIKDSLYIIIALCMSCCLHSKHCRDLGLNQESHALVLIGPCRKECVSPLNQDAILLHM